MPSLLSWFSSSSNGKGAANNASQRSNRVLHAQDMEWSTSQDDYQTIDPYASSRSPTHARADSGSSISFPPQSTHLSSSQRSHSSLTSPYSSSAQIPPSPGLGGFHTSFDLSSSDAVLPATYPSSSHSYYASSSTYPPIKQTFKRFRRILGPAFPELLDTLNSPLAPLDLQAMCQALSYRDGLPVALPADVKEYLASHDGQDVFSLSSTAIAGNSGLLWGLWLMTSDEIVTEWQMLRKMEARMRAGNNTAVVDDPFAQYYRQAQRDSTNAQSSCPHDWVKPLYSSPGWIPLAKDNAGNYIGIDLDPPRQNQSKPSTPQFAHSSNFGASSSRLPSNAQMSHSGQPGQVIAFGREIDTKTVLFPGYATIDPSNPASDMRAGGWARFLSAYVDDLDSGEFGSLGAADRNKQPVSEDADNDDAASIRTQSSDGIGSLGYFEATRDDAYSNQQERPQTSRRRKHGLGVANGAGTRWCLHGEYSNMGVIEALCLRSRRKWQELGIEPTEQVLRTEGSAQAMPKRSFDRPRSLDSTGQPRASSLPPLPPSPHLVLSPPSPPNVDSSLQGLTESPRTSLDSQKHGVSNKGKGRVTFNQDVETAENQRQAKRRSQLPPPSQVALPTLADLMLDELDKQEMV